MKNLCLAYFLMLLAFLVCLVAYPYVLRFAIRRNIVDSPNDRKLQRVPVPVMGGTAVFLGILVSTVTGFLILGDTQLMWALLMLFIMYAIGVWDDINDVPASLRFLAEMIVVWGCIRFMGLEMNDLHGFWGTYIVSGTFSIPLSFIAGVGIMNAVNLIDGVDGYCSSYGVFTCLAFAILFYRAGDVTMFVLSMITCGALIPFFFHNVFGKTSKMFLGDGGSLMLGMALTMFTFSALTTNSPCKNFGKDGLSLVALTLAIMAIPVFDTLKVMVYRIVRGHSPFRADKTHLHHLFIEMDFSHLATSAIIVTCNILIVCALLIAWKLGASINFQVYLVIGLALLITCGFYFFMESHRRQNHGKGSELFQKMCVAGRKTHLSTFRWWRSLARLMDSRLLGGKASIAQKEKPQKSPGRLDPRIR